MLLEKMKNMLTAITLKRITKYLQERNEQQSYLSQNEHQSYLNPNEPQSDFNGNEQQYVMNYEAL